MVDVGGMGVVAWCMSGVGAVLLRGVFEWCRCCGVSKAAVFYEEPFAVLSEKWLVS